MTAPAHDEMDRELDELEAIAAQLAKRVAKLKAARAGVVRVVDREPPPEAYAELAAFRRRRGRR